MEDEIILDPKALDAILAKEAKDLTDPEIDLFISAIRLERKRVLEAERAGKRKGKSPVNAALEEQKAKDLKFEDLGL